MKKFTIILAGFLLVFIANRSMAQLTVGVSGGMNYLNNYKPGAGIDASIGSEKYGFGLSFGYNSLDGEDIDDGSLTIKIIPMTFYSDTYFGKGKVRFICRIRAGAYNLKTEGEVAGYDMSSSKTYFGGGGNLGADFKFIEHLGITASFRYDYVLSKGESTDWFSPNLAVRYIF